MMNNKIEAFLDRKEMRGCFDMEFILRQGIKLNAVNADKVDLVKMKKIIGQLRKSDYTVKLGPMIDAEMRNYYTKNNFSFLLQRINSLLL